MEKKVKLILIISLILCLLILISLFIFYPTANVIRVDSSGNTAIGTTSSGISSTGIGSSSSGISSTQTAAVSGSWYSCKELEDKSGVLTKRRKSWIYRFFTRNEFIENTLYNRCIADSSLVYYCDGNIPRYKRTKCADGCENGACIEEDYESELYKEFISLSTGISVDLIKSPYNLDSNVKYKLDYLSNLTNNTNDSIIVYNGEIFINTNFTILKENTKSYVIPTGYNGNIKYEIPVQKYTSIEDYLNSVSESINKNILDKQCRGMINNKSQDEINTEIKTILQNARNNNQITDFELDEYEAYITYPNEEFQVYIPFYESCFYAAQYFMISPNNWEKEYIESLNLQKDFNKMALYNQEPLFLSYTDFNSLLSFFQTKNKNQEQSSDSSNTVSNEEINEHLSRNEVIVSPTKNVIFFIFPDYNFKTDIEFKSKAFNQLIPLLELLRQNSYQVSIKIFYWNQESFETFYNVYKNDSFQIILWWGHGSQKGSLFIEGHNLIDFNNINKNSILEYDKKYNSFIKRFSELKKIYKGVGANLNDPSVININGKNKTFYKSGTISLSSEFFREYFYPLNKSFVLTAQCYGGQIADDVHARAFVAGPINDKVSINYYKGTGIIYSDLLKISNVLKSDPNFFKETNNYFSSSRTFKSINLLEFRLFSSVFISKDTSFLSKPNILSQFNLRSGDGLIQISPHVQKIDLNEIRFSAPMETRGQHSAENIIEIDTSQCDFEIPKERYPIPEWINDKTIRLNFPCSPVYRSFNNNDFNKFNKPITNLVKITVKSENAVSKYSKIPLTGNDNGFKLTEQLVNPTDTRWNGNAIKKDFIYYLPCNDIRQPRGMYQIKRGFPIPILRVEEYDSSNKEHRENINDFKYVEVSEEVSSMTNGIRLKDNSYYSEEDKCYEECKKQGCTSASSKKILNNELVTYKQDVGSCISDNKQIKDIIDHLDGYELFEIKDSCLLTNAEIKSQGITVNEENEAICICARKI